MLSKGLFSEVDGLMIFSPSTQHRIRHGDRKSSLVEGFDSSILIDPRRLHMTLGVMALEQDDDSVEPTEAPETTTTSRPLTQRKHYRRHFIYLL
jgi:hypothetical protein